MRAALWLLAGGLAFAALFVARRAGAAELPPAKVVQGVSGRPVPRGIKNNNPGNLRPGDPWRGRVGTDSANYLIFDTPVNGIRALTMNLLHQQTKHGLTTVRAIIEKWAPLDENPAQPAYIANVAAAVGVDPDAELDLASDPDALRAFVLAVILQENGQQPYDDQTIDAGIAAGVGDA